MAKKRSRSVFAVLSVCLLVSCLSVVPYVSGTVYSSAMLSLQNTDMDRAMEYYQYMNAPDNWTAVVSWAGVVPTNATGEHTYYFQLFNNVSTGFAVVVVLRNTTDNDVSLVSYEDGVSTGTVHEALEANVTQVKVTNDVAGNTKLYLGTNTTAVHSQAGWAGSVTQLGYGTTDADAVGDAHYTGTIYFAFGSGSMADMGIMLGMLLPSMLSLVVTMGILTAIFGMIGGIGKKIRM